MTIPKPMVEFASTGRFLPERVMTNRDLESIVDTNDAWIIERTGIRERRIADSKTTAADLGTGAARIAMENAGVTAEDVDILIVSTATPDRLLPSTACDVQRRLQAKNAFAFDLQAACSGFLYGVSMAEGFLALNRGDVALIVGAEKMSSIIDWEDRATCVLFGDGAGAAVLRRSSGERGIISSHHRSDGDMADYLVRPAGGSHIPLDADGLARKDHLVKMSGREVFRKAVRCMCDAAGHALEAANMTADDIDIMVPHQANLRIIEATAKYTGISMDKVYVNLDRYGNMSSATIPVALDEAAESGRLQPGMNVLSVAFGAGLTWSAMVYRW